MPIRTPSYRFHKARNCAVVTIAGKDRYLGQYDSPESWEKYHRLIAEWLANQQMPPTPPTEIEAPPITVSQLVLRYWRFVQSYYIKDGKPTSEQIVIRQALRFVRKLYGSTAAGFQSQIAQGGAPSYDRTQDYYQHQGTQSDQRRA
jgi:hypothetical protein